MSRALPSDNWRSLLLWAGAVLIVVAAVVSFVLWGTNGPAYLIDLIVAYCS